MTLTEYDIPDVLSPGMFPGVVSAVRTPDGVQVRTSWADPDEIIVQDMRAGDLAASICGNARADIGEPYVNVDVFASDGSLLAYYGGDGTCHHE